MSIEPEAEKSCEEWQAAMRAGGHLDVTATNATSLLSIAISMRRIADEICSVAYDNAPGADNSRHKMGMVDGVMHAIEQGILAASHRG